MASRIAALVVACIVLISLPVCAQQTPASLVNAYDDLADTILAVRAAEASLVTALLEGHYDRAQQHAKAGDWPGAAAHMAMFANEGDNAIAGVRKRLLEGGHHFNAVAEGEEQRPFEDGYVIVSREAKAGVMAAVQQLRQAKDDAARKAAWAEFAAIAEPLLASD